MQYFRITVFCLTCGLLFTWSSTGASRVCCQDLVTADLRANNAILPNAGALSVSSPSRSRLGNAATLQGTGVEGRTRLVFAGLRAQDSQELPSTENRLELQSEEGETAEGEFEVGEEIETDRDSFTPSTKTVASGRWLFESSYSFIDQREGFETHSFPEILVRYGLTDRLELRLGWNYEIGGPNSILSGNTTEHHSLFEEGSRFLYGAKFALLEQAGVQPEASLIIQGSTPTFGESSITNFSATSVAGWQFQNDLTLDFATRFQTSHEDEDHFNVWSPSAVLKMPIGEYWKAHVEYFGVLTDERHESTQQHFFSPGIHRLIHQDLEVGVRVGWGLNHTSPEFFSNIGFGWQY
jgi:hypothetical protein